MLSLFERYPNLRDTLSHIELAQLPTPVLHADRLGKALGHTGLYIKRDDLTGQPYGGNKLRKLEFLLAEAKRNGYSEVLTFGCAGSNHATATAIYARKIGLRSISVLLPQDNAHSVQKNLLLSLAHGAEFRVYETFAEQTQKMPEVLACHEEQYGRSPYVIPPGGSSPLGVVGYVNAAMELADQVAAGQIPEPDTLFVAAGTTGTAVGLILGLRVVGLKTQVVPVRVTDERFANPTVMLNLCRETNVLLHERDAAFPEIVFSEGDFAMRRDCFGEKYAVYTEESVAACKRLLDTEGIPLEGTYTGKALAALIKDVRNGTLKNQTALFWNTYNSRDVSGLIDTVVYHQLPEALHHYFEEDVQPLDREHY